MVRRMVGMRVLVASLLLFPLLAVAATPLAPYRASYMITRGGNPIGELHQSLHYHGRETLIFESQRFSSGFQAMVAPSRESERTLWVWQPPKMVPLEYLTRSQRLGLTETRRIEFDWQAKELRLSLEGGTTRLPLTPGVVDRLLLQLVIRHDLMQGGSERLDYRVQRFEGVESWRVVAHGEELVDIQNGKLRAIRVESGGQQLWLDPVREYLPLRFSFEEEGERVEIRLHDYQRR